MTAGKARREQILELIQGSAEPVSASSLAQQFDVSRQVIVQDVALLRAADHPIISTVRGYRMEQPAAKLCRKVFKVRHTREETAEELRIIVDNGGRVVEVFVNHKVYGVISAPLNIQSRLDIDQLMGEIESGYSDLLMHMTSGYHFHTVEAPSPEILDRIREKLAEKGFLTTVRDYEEHLVEERARNCT